VKQGIQENLGINPINVAKVNIKGKVLVKTHSGETRVLSLKKAKKYVSNCTLCPDFSAELADISVGGLGLEDWTLTIIRTEKGESIFQMAEDKGVIRTRPIEDETGVLNLLVKISKRKRGTS